jgi:type I restriction enzyme M protein
VLESLQGLSQLEHYKELLLRLGSSVKPKAEDSDGDAEKQEEEHEPEAPIAAIVQEIFANASTFIKKATTLTKLVSEIDKLDWYSARQEGLGDLHEGLLQKNAEEKKSGAGQYFTPRPLIDVMVAVMQPKLEDVIQDPAAGTGGFLIAAQHWIREQQDVFVLDERQQQKFYGRTFYGMEHVQDTHRLALMNLMLHGLDSRPGQSGI